ncbi:hypothetical protein MVES1_003392 [Malassezia vespertilionis]|uniref:Mediator complex subunit 18 n=1 Tax=Malassezia vespertilionis TaxID=2020962 RepID=A0A2N1J789_9BASI|nr:uncharacterized protein MVES1_003392 [Malassezia vespertilionis]PKI82423.1 hypothetical protein MVES_003633 [Malassezia vespertilionis]WFD08023.1 hypothetical protein MVES1_003392 [Malassezia vespertilionis]
MAAASSKEWQHTQVSAAGTIEPLHVHALLEMLGRKVNVPPTVFVVRESQLRRADDESQRPLEMSDSKWSNVRRAREQTRITVRTEDTTYVLAVYLSSQFLLPLPPAPPGATPSMLVRSIVMAQEMTPCAATTTPAPLESSTIFSTPVHVLEMHAAHHTGWDVLAHLLNWAPAREQLHFGLRFVLLSEDPRVVHELRVFRSTEWTSLQSDAHSVHAIAPGMHVRALSSFRSDVGPGVPKREQEASARALEYALHHMQQLQKSLDPFVPLHRDV